ncbi:MAG TPA: DNA-3-methyladenine glycosylase [Nitrososphaera sp.]|jgi:DNA-3-methyladenine glycosylase II
MAKRSGSAKAERHLSAADPCLATIISSVGRCDIKIRDVPFQSLAEAIIYQQLAGAAADAIYGRFLKIYRGRFPSPGRLIATSDEKLRAAGLSARKAEYLKDLARHIDDGRIKPRLLHSLTDEQVVEQLVKVKGIGRWTAEMFLIFCLGRPDVLPVGDLGLRKAIQRTYSLQDLPSEQVMNDIARTWRPYRSIATWYLWKSLEKFKGIG